MTVRLAGAPVSWGVDFAGARENPSPESVLDGLRSAGLRYAELGPPGFIPPRRGILNEFGLASVGTFVFHPFHAREARLGALAAARTALDCLELHGGRTLVLVDRPSGARAAAAGRPAEAPRLDAPAWRGMMQTLREVAAVAGRHGVRAVVHPHAGSRIEFADEIDRLLDDLAPHEVGLCLDTGHALYAGEDPAALLLRHAERVEHLHIKDIHPSRLAAAHAARADFWAAVAGGVFCPVGDGLLDLDGIARAVASVGYTGFATVEQDRRPGSPGRPEADLYRSVQRLVAAGLGRRS
jgi:inosose dehydratase